MECRVFAYLETEKSTAMNGLYRGLIALATVLPISIPYAYVFIEKLLDLIPESVRWRVDEWILVGAWMAVIFIGNYLVGRLIVWVLRVCVRYTEPRAIRVRTAKPLGADCLMGYLPYVLPMFVTQSDAQGMAGWLLGLMLLWVLSWTAMTIPYSPLLRLCGLRFYEVELESGMTVTLLIDNRKITPFRLKSAAYISESCRYGIS